MSGTATAKSRDERRGRAPEGGVLAVRIATLLLLMSAQGALHAQQPELTLGAMATGVVTRADPAYAGRTYTEAQLVQPNVLLTGKWRALSLRTTLNAEGWTLKRGELDAGIYGEGYVDRRHPHTLLHEAMLAVQTPRALAGPFKTLWSLSLAGGKGFVAYGTDDPMMRPFEKYPVNHHHAQILERAQVIGAVMVARGAQALTVEGTLFNGDEPTGPFAWPQWSRTGDSKAGRATVRFARGIEGEASRAFVRSPEIIQGGAFDHAMQSYALRVDRPTAKGNTRYLMAEWARTDERLKGRDIFRYESALAEGAAGWHGATMALRLERTDRAEQRRLLDPFRTPLGHIDFQIIGVTRWSVATVALESPALTRGAGRAVTRLSSFVEIARSVPVPRSRPTLFEPAEFYGASTLWSFTIGLRVHAGTMPARMGRYGVLASPQDATMHHDHDAMQSGRASSSFSTVTRVHDQ